MNKYIFLLTVTATFLTAASCNSPKESENEPTKVPTSESSKSVPELRTEKDTAGIATEDNIPLDSATEFPDSFVINVDSLMKARVVLPPVYQHEIVEANEEATDKFDKLSKACNGRMKILVNSSAVVHELESTIKSISVRDADLLILLDRTYSMHDHIENVKIGINQIIDTIKKYKGTWLAVAIYGDKNYDGDSWFAFHNFEKDYEAAAEYVKQVQVRANYDWPESVYDAVMRSMENDFWKSTKKCNIILVGDAPPLEKPLSNYTLQDVIAKARERKVRMNFYPILIMPQIKEIKLSEAEKEKYKEITHNTKLYPNPCRGVLNLSMETTGTYYLELYNSSGETVWNEEFFGITWTKDIRDLPNGMYIIRVINADRTYELIKFILQH